MTKFSAGILLYRNHHPETEVLLVHPGGPYWRGKDLGAWSIPKGEYTNDEEPLAAAKREFQEETGFPLEGDEFRRLCETQLPSGKVISAWAVEGDCDAAAIRSNLFSMEWPPRSGKMREFPEVDRAAWFPVSVARVKLHPAQGRFVDCLVGMLNAEVAKQS
jgi:predicted NUDIX family NTP pyrophosphohydrolase